MANGRTIYLHIGTEKTGTTTLQAMFSANRTVLEKAGVLYPNTPGKGNHAGLAIYALPLAKRPDLHWILRMSTSAEVEAYRDRFVSDFSGELDGSDCKDVVMSSEHLSSRVREKHALDRLFDVLGKLADRIKVIVYLRPQHELAPSSYSTTVKSGNTKPFRVPQSDDDYFYNFDMLTRNWEVHAGRENVIVRLFARNTFKDNSLVSDIFDAMDLAQPADLVIPGDKNTALAADTLEFMRVANGIIPRYVGGSLNPNHVALVRYLTRLGPTPKFQIDRQAIETIERMFLDSNRAVAERYFPALNGRLFPAAHVAEDAAEPPTAEAMVRIGVGIWRSRKLLARQLAKSPLVEQLPADVSDQG